MKKFYAGLFKISLFFASISIFGSISNHAFAQDEEMTLPDSLFNMSLEALMNIEVVSASKKKELRTDSPFSIAVISKETILQSGATSLSEVFRLVPGMVVREQSPGNFEVHIRGLDYLTPVGNQFTIGESTLILVMIDGRPVFNYFQGGTFWETLPVALEQIERIEIISGAASALYGQNAAAGAINIITSKEVKNATSGSLTTQVSNVGDMLTNGTVLHRLNDKWTSGFSFRQAYRKRDFQDYFSYRKNGYVNRDSLLFRTGNAGMRTPQPDLSQDLKSVNSFFSYSPNEDVQVVFSAGLERSFAQKIYQDNQVTPLTSNVSSSQYADISLRYKGLTSQASYNQGNQEVIGSIGWMYEFKNVDAKVEYDWFFKNLHIRPGASYRLSIFDDIKSANQIGVQRAFLDGKERTISTLSSYIMADYTLNKLRIGGIARLDFYNVPNAAYFNYNLFATYKPNESLMFRLVHGKANRGSFILDAFYGQEINFGSSTAILRGNSNLNLTNVLSYEAGIRTPLALGLLMDVEVFRSEVSNFYTSMAVANSNPSITESQLQNLPTQAVQNGATFALVFLEKKTSLQVNAYVTYQKTSLSNFYTDKNGQVQYVDIEHEATPHFLGGMNLYWKYKKFSINGQSWYMGKQELNTIVGPRASQISADNLVINPYLGANLKVSYHLNSNWRMFINARNILNGGQVQSFMGDKLPTIVFAGLNLRW